jgi:XTP/dITP diphosphohydrolase
MITLVISTRNAHKMGEIRAILGSSFRYLTLKDFSSAPMVVEDASTFAGNACKKAIELAKWLASKPSRARLTPPAFVLADDSGLEVDALRGAPGVHSARFAAIDAGGAGNSSDLENNAKLLRLLEGVPEERRTARFRCVLALTPIIEVPVANNSPVCEADQFELVTQTFEGVCEGHIGFQPRGQAGFGYDPLFSPIGHERTFAELGEDVKNGLSHRAKALWAMKSVIAA